MEVLHSGIAEVFKKEKKKNELPSFCCSTVYCTTDLRALVNAHTYADTRDVTDRAAAPECAQRRKKKKKKSSLRTHRALSFCLFLFFFFYACLFFVSVCLFFPVDILNRCFRSYTLLFASHTRRYLLRNAEEKKKKKRTKRKLSDTFLSATFFLSVTHANIRAHT